jgi:hypothetical protein
MAKIEDPCLDAKDLLISRLKHELESRERIIGALLDKLGRGGAGSAAYISKQDYMAPWRRVFVTPSGDNALRITVWKERLCEPYRGGACEQIPSEPMPWDVQDGDTPQQMQSNGRRKPKERNDA